MSWSLIRVLSREGERDLSFLRLSFRSSSLSLSLRDFRFSFLSSLSLPLSLSLPFLSFAFFRLRLSSSESVSDDTDEERERRRLDLCFDFRVGELNVWISACYLDIKEGKKEIYAQSSRRMLGGRRPHGDSRLFTLATPTAST
jgi:hypothetical protein